ncbi:hypothetical protein NPIL_663381, partial [Nephila pilipes]
GGGRVSHLLRFEASTSLRNRISSLRYLLFFQASRTTFPVIRRIRSRTNGKSQPPFYASVCRGGGKNEAYRNSVPRPLRSDSSLPKSNVIAMPHEENERDSKDWSVFYGEALIVIHFWRGFVHRSFFREEK